MAVRSNIGKLRNALSAANAMKQGMNTGPFVSPETKNARYSLAIADFGASDRITDGFIFGVDVWGSKTKKVTKN